MKVVVKDLSAKDVGELQLSQAVFGASVREDIIARVIAWQLAKRRSGNHKTKGVSDVSGTTRKPWKQKGTGRARAGSLRSAQFRGGGIIFGPVVRDHGYSLPKKIRNLGLRSVLSAKFSEKNIIIVDDLQVNSWKTKDFLAGFENFGIQDSVLIVGGADVPPQFCSSIRNLHKIDVLPQHAINVYDVLRHRHLVLSRDAVAYLEKRLVVVS